ncbi:MAG: hypothetical protein LBV08_05505 [Clostridiales bacterium]|nr:hypothetical protein [Clostridiales bacterium]
MTRKLKSAFDAIHAGSGLKSKTLDALKEKINNPQPQNKKLFLARYAFIPIFIAVFLISTQLYYFVNTPDSYINLDVNPSIELTLNQFNYVIGAKAYNASGSNIINNLPLRHKEYSKAVQILIDEMIKQNILGQDGLVSVTVQNNNNSKEILDTLKIAVSASLKPYSHVSAEFFPVSEEIQNTAHESNISPARYIAITELQEVDPTATFESCANHSISQIRQLTKEHMGRHFDSGNVAPAPNSGGMGHGHGHNRMGHE